MAAENRLTADQLAVLTPGDPVTIETSGDFRRPKHSAGTVVRIAAGYLVVSSRSARGVPYVDRYSRRDGVRIGGGQRAELVNAEATTAATADPRRLESRVDAAYRAWRRSPGDLERLRELRAAVGDLLEESLVQAR